MTNGIAADQLRAFVERVELVEAEIADLQAHRKEIYAGAKAQGYDTKAMRAVVRLRKLDSNERQEQEALQDLYLHALGMAPEGAE